MIRLPKQVIAALRLLEESGHEAYIVGGCVRDYIMGIEPHDYDITTSALPEETKQVFSGYQVIDTGIKHGTVTVVIDHEPIEITTFRIDDDYLDGRHPSKVRFTKSLKEDAARRDFTMNAIAMDYRGNLYDYFGGKEDIDKGIIRCVLEPAARFREDALRIMRALRFSSVTGFNIEAKTHEAMRDSKELLLKISAERIREELVKLLCGKNVKKILMEDVDILAVFMPELAKMKGFDQRNPHHVFDVLEHTAEVVQMAKKEPVIRLAALFHDIGKPECFTVDEKGIGHFYGHGAISTEITRSVMNRLKFDNDTKKKVLELVENHDAPIEPSERAVKRVLNKLSQEQFFNLIELKRADNLGQSRDFRDRQLYYDRLVEIAGEIIAQEQCFSLKDLCVNGRDLISIGFKPGKGIGEMLKFLLDEVIDGKIENERQKLLDLAQKKKKNY